MGNKHHAKQLTYAAIFLCAFILLSSFFYNRICLLKVKLFNHKFDLRICNVRKINKYFTNIDVVGNVIQTFFIKFWNKTQIDRQTTG